MLLRKLFTSSPSTSQWSLLRSPIRTGVRLAHGGKGARRALSPVRGFATTSSTVDEDTAEEAAKLLPFEATSNSFALLKDRGVIELR